MRAFVFSLPLENTHTGSADELHAAQVEILGREVDVAGSAVPDEAPEHLALLRKKRATRLTFSWVSLIISIDIYSIITVVIIH